MLYNTWCETSATRDGLCVLALNVQTQHFVVTWIVCAGKLVRNRRLCQAPAVKSLVKPKVRDVNIDERCLQHHTGLTYQLPPNHLGVGRPASYKCPGSCSLADCNKSVMENTTSCSVYIHVVLNVCNMYLLLQNADAIVETLSCQLGCETEDTIYRWRVGL